MVAPFAWEARIFGGAKPSSRTVAATPNPSARGSSSGELGCRLLFLAKRRAGWRRHAGDEAVGRRGPQ
eukprot:558082-Lingulodinium_polyedra.AAC.1